MLPSNHVNKLLTPPPPLSLVSFEESLTSYKKHTHSHIKNFLNNKTNRALLGVDKSFQTPWESFNLQINAQFDKVGDILHPSTNHISALLERSIPILIFVGVHDLICNHVGTERWALGMAWSGKDAFGSAEVREWFVDGKRAGAVRSAKGLTYATVDGAGHMVRLFFLRSYLSQAIVSTDMSLGSL
jgi:carboxypeptidase C (cathepsin A)